LEVNLKTHVGGQRGIFSKVVLGFRNLGYDMGKCLKVTLQICALEKFPLMLMGGRAEGQACTDPGAKTLISVRGIFFIFILV
jgi:hypothetical protein